MYLYLGNCFLFLDDGKDYDVFVLYEMKEINFVTGVLIPTLCNEYDYTLSSHALESNVGE